MRKLTLSLALILASSGALAPSADAAARSNPCGAPGRVVLRETLPRLDGSGFAVVTVEVTYSRNLCCAVFRQPAAAMSADERKNGMGTVYEAARGLARRMMRSVSKQADAILFAVNQRRAKGAVA